MDFVLDCSSTLSWAFKDESSEYSRRLQEFLVENTAVVPSIWSLEILNGLFVAVRRGRMEPNEPQEFISMLGSLPITVRSNSAEHEFNNLPNLIQTYQLSSYDAAYIELAQREMLPIATQDRNIIQSANQLVINVLDENDLS